MTEKEGERKGSIVNKKQKEGIVGIEKIITSTAV